MINLTQQEREKFAAFLEQEAESALGLAEQAEKLKTPPTDSIAKKLRIEVAANRIVAGLLRSTETDTIVGT
jgi:hypothetical protein